MKHKVLYDDAGPVAARVLHHGRSYIATRRHPNFPEIIDALEQGRGPEEVIDLFDIGSALARGFARARKLIRKVASSRERRVVAEPEEQAAEVVDLARKTLTPEPEPELHVVRLTESTEETDELDELSQRQLQAKLKQLGLGSGVGRTKAWMRERIREARNERLVHVADHVEVKNGRLYYEGEEVNGALADAIISYHAQGHRDFTPLVRFLAKLLENPNPHSREHLYQWMRHLSFTIADDGDILAYKGVVSVVREGRNDPEFVSDYRWGTAKSNGVLYKGMRIPNPIGAVVEMPRHEVTFDPTKGCHTGLHIGTVSYAQGFGDTMVEVKVHPADVVSVPTHNNWEKLRVCKYRVLRKVAPSEARTLKQHQHATA